MRLGEIQRQRHDLQNLIHRERGREREQAEAQEDDHRGYTGNPGERRRHPQGIRTGLAQDAPKGYAALARLHQAAQSLKSGDRPGAMLAFEQLANDGSVDPLFREVAVIHWAYHGLDDADPAKMSERLKPLTVQNNPWRHMALELSALYAERAGRRTDAIQILTDLEKDTSAPQGVRGRAKELLAILGKS